MRRTSGLRLLRLANPAVRALLRSPAHPVLSGSLALVEYRGHRSGRRFAIPVLYAEIGDELVVLAASPDRKLWWRTFREGAAATLLVRGTPRECRGQVAVGPERTEALRAYLGRHPRARRPLGLPASATDDELEGTSAALVVFRPAP